MQKLGTARRIAFSTRILQVETNMKRRIAIFAADRTTLRLARLFLVLLVAIAVLLVGVGGASAQTVWNKDPDSRVDPAKVVTSTLLPAPDTTIGNLDTTIVG